SLRGIESCETRGLGFCGMKKPTPLGGAGFAWLRSFWLLAGANAADGGAAVGALALRDGLAVLRRALHRVLHNLLGLALHAVSFDCHSVSTSLCLSMYQRECPQKSLQTAPVRNTCP